MANALPDLKLLRIFVSVVRHQGFANAQQELNLSTSAISTYMSQLEAALGLVLCHRGRGGFSLTSKGELFHQETLRLLAELEGFEQYAAALKGELRGTLNLGVIDSTVSDKALPFAEAIGAYSQEHPAVHLHLSVMSPYELQLGVQDNRLDLAIGAFSTRMSGLVYMPLLPRTTLAVLQHSPSAVQRAAHPRASHHPTTHGRSRLLEPGRTGPSRFQAQRRNRGEYGGAS